MNFGNGQQILMGESRRLDNLGLDLQKKSENKEMVDIRTETKSLSIEYPVPWLLVVWFLHTTYPGGVF